MEPESLSPRIRRLGLADYSATWDAMRSFTRERQAETPDELWLLQHPPVYTLGLAGDPAHLLQASDIPLVHIDRGGQITYHGPGQAIVYPLIDLQRRRLKVREWVQALERAVLAVLAGYGLSGHLKVGAPGVYIEGAKIAALGLKITRGCCYHGVSLNVAMDLAPFAAINPCGYPGLETIQLSDLGVSDPVDTVLDTLAAALLAELDAYPITQISERNPS